MRVAILVTHLLGTGHLSRMLTLARAFRDAGMSPCILSGGMPTPHLDQSNLDVVQLPAVRSDGAQFTRLLDAAGAAASSDLLGLRAQVIAEAIRDFAPAVLVTELFPFGRRVLTAEFAAALAAAESLAARPLVLASVRDILSAPSSAGKAAQTEALLARHYDGVLVHSDASVVPLEASWPVTPPTAGMLRYTGFIAAGEAAGNGNDGNDEILVTAGGGPVGRALFDMAIEAARLGERRWRLLVGGADAAAVCARLNQAAAGAPVLAEPARADYRAMLARSPAAVGQCGYNTAIDWLQAGVPGVFVPFAEAGETEQSLRAALLADRYGYGVIAEAALDPRKLADAVEAAIRRGRFSAAGLQLDGALQSARIVGAMLEARS